MRMVRPVVVVGFVHCHQDSRLVAAVVWNAVISQEVEVFWRCFCSLKVVGRLRLVTVIHGRVWAEEYALTVGYLEWRFCETEQCPWEIRHCLYEIIRVVTVVSVGRGSRQLCTSMCSGLSSTDIFHKPG